MQVEELANLIYRNVTLVTPRLHALGLGTPFSKVASAVNRPNDIGNAILRLHVYNYNVWHAEDICRSGEDALIPDAKRIIDKNNQARCDAAEELDDLLGEAVKFDGYLPSDVPTNSETPGSIIDRISIADLKIYHTEEIHAKRYAEDRAVSIAHRGAPMETDEVDALNKRLFSLINQKHVLLKSLLELLREVKLGKRVIYRHRQYKMYNDPATNLLHKDRK